MTPTTATQYQIEHELGRPLAGYVREKRRNGRGWRQIANEIAKDTGVFVSHMSLHRWYGKRL